MTPLPHTLWYNLVMIVVDLAVLVLFFRQRTARAWCAGLVCAGAFAVALALRLGEDRFGAARLAAYGLFLHGEILLAGSALLWWRSKRIVAFGCVIGALALGAVAGDAFLIEPTWLEVSYRRIASEKIEQPIRIVVLADLQTDRIGPYEREVFLRILQEEPDVILLAGDYLQPEWELRPKLRRELNALLHEIGFPGKARAFAVRGNIDPEGWEEMFDGLEVETVGAIGARQSHALGDLRVTCLGIGRSYRTSLVFPGRDPDRFHIVVGHVPNFALGRVDADLLVAGHTHGGQVQLPWIGPLTCNCEIPRRWASGWTDLPGGGQLVVSRGVGMERHFAPRLRFFCRPELVVIDLVPTNE